MPTIGYLNSGAAEIEIEFRISEEEIRAEAAEAERRAEEERRAGVAEEERRAKAEEERRAGVAEEERRIREDIDLLARIIFAEARGEPYEGKIAVGAVVLNRVNDSRFPNSVKKVIFQPGQFCGAGNSNFNKNPCKDSYQAAKEALAGKNPIRGALYFLNHDIAGTPRWIESKKRVAKIGNHTFYK